MSVLESYLCLGGVELSNHARVAAYVNNVGVPGATMPTECACDLIDFGFDLPQTDPAPWYEATRPESQEFLGFYANRMELQNVVGREMEQASRRGAHVGALTLRGRILQVSGLMMATSCEGMAYGERWLANVLRGGPCNVWGEADDTAVILPACNDNYGAVSPFRHLVGVGVLDFPPPGPVGSLPRCKVQEVSFILGSQSPYLFHPPDPCYDGTPLSGTLQCMLTTPEWMGDGTFVIEVGNVGTTDVTDLVIEGKLSVDGSCPPSGAAAAVPPSFTYTIPTLAPEDRIVIDGTRYEVRHWDASLKARSPGMRLIEFEGPFNWPDVGPCSSMCVTIEASGGTAEVSVDRRLREV